MSPVPVAKEKEYLARANEAEEKANKAQSVEACKTWLDLAMLYREMAQLAGREPGRRLISS